MLPCLLCGSDDGEKRKGLEIQCCIDCDSYARNLQPEAISALMKLEDIKPAFDVWWQGQRDTSLPVEQPAEVVPGLFIGDLDDASNVNKIWYNGIRTVLNLCPENLIGAYADLPSRLTDAGIWMLATPAEDQWDYDIVKNVIQQGAVDFIETRLRFGGVLVNCWAGVNRSAAVVVAFLMLKKNFSLVDAVRETMSQRGTVLTNRAFRRLLLEVCLANGCNLASGDPSPKGTPSGWLNSCSFDSV